MDTSSISEIFSGMISIPTVSGEGNEEIYEIDRYKNYLRSQFPVLFHKAEVTPIGNALLLFLRGDEEKKQGELLPVLFTGHMDVVPIPDENVWLHPPFSGEIADGCVWGRGSQDMKCAQCALLYAWDNALKEGIRHRRGVYLYLSCDEETGGKTTEKAAEYLKNKGVKLEAVFDEGGMITDTFMKLKKRVAMLGIAEKGSLKFRFTARSSGGHASNPPKNTVIVKMAELITDLEQNSPFRQELTVEAKIMLKKAMEEIAESDPRRKKFEKALQEKAPYSELHELCADANAMLGATIAFTMIEGGTAFNALPTNITMIANVRTGSNQKADEIRKILTKKANQYGITCSMEGGEDASLITDLNSWGYQTMADCVRKTFKDVVPLPFVLYGGTDSKHFQQLTQQIIRFSPIYTTDDQGRGVHGNNEYCNIDAVEGGALFYYNLIKDYL